MNRHRFRYIINKDKWFIRVKIFNVIIYIDWNMLFIEGLNISVYNGEEI